MRTRPFFAARAEDRWNQFRGSLLRRWDWVASVIPFTGYGTDQQLRVLARVVLRPKGQPPLLTAAEAFLHRRGWRNFMAVPVVREPVRLSVGDEHLDLVTDRGGYIDIRIKNPGLQPGWRTVSLVTAEREPVEAPLLVVPSEVTFGIVSDIDDTIISTLLPRPFIAAWNSFVLTEQARQPVIGMARLYQKLLDEHPGSPLIFVSTGSWNTHPFLTRFMTRYGFPPGPMLLTDWGPTNTGWFRSGAEHKRRALRELARDFPNIRWLLIGDDGQHDPALYAEFASLQPEHVRARAIRQLTFTESFLAHGLGDLTQREQEWTPDTAPEVRGADGDELGAKLRAIL
ncbi:MAG: DUF2183 domain-containing protein [Propionibacteriaceae bacterium]|nr:DUF2183 domain-containing protein [Propionibacteriaceae bacterium]